MDSILGVLPPFSKELFAPEICEYGRRDHGGVRVNSPKGNQMEEANKDSTDIVRPVGVLETLGDALTAAFDEEMARWRGAAQSYCETLRHETHRCRQAPQRASSATDSIVSSRHEGQASCWDVRESSVGAMDSPSQSDDSAFVAVGNSETSLAGKWAELEEMLASIRPSLHEHKRQGKKVVAPMRQHMRPLPREIGGWRLHYHERQCTPLGRDAESDTPASRRTLCKKVLDAWAETAQARAVKTAKYQTASRHWRQSKRVAFLKAWRSLCLHRRAEQARGQLVTHSIRSHRQQTTLQRWWIASRWTRGHRRLKSWADARRLECAMVVWRDLVETAQCVKSLRRRACGRRVRAAFAVWRAFRSGCQEKRARIFQVRQFILRRYLSALAHGTSTARARRVRWTGFRQRCTVTTLRRAFDMWIRHNDSKRKTYTAIAWRRHCLQSACFEAWNLLHRCFTYHKQITARARTHYASRLTKQLFGNWREVVRLGQRQRSAIMTLARRILTRAGFHHLQCAVQADRDRAHALVVWKIRRYIVLWNRRAHDRHKLANRYRATQQLHRHHTLGRVVWSPWRQAYLSRLQSKQVSLVVRHHVLQKCWTRWTAYERWKEARHELIRFVDHSKQRWTFQQWQMYCIKNATQRAKIEMGTRHRHFALLTRSQRRWKCWMQDLHKARALDATALQCFGRLVLRRWSRRARLEKRRVETLVVQIFHRHPLWLTRSSFTAWRHHVASRIRCRHVRLFYLWRAHSSRRSQLRTAQTLSCRIWMRRLWMRWTRYIVFRTRARTASQLLLRKNRQNVLAHCFHYVWRAKVTRFSQARHKLQCVSMGTTKGICVKRWWQRVAAARQTRRAADHFRAVLWKTYFHRLYQNAIVRPQAFRHARIVRIQSLVFHSWKIQFQAQQHQRGACKRLNLWRKHRVLRRLSTRVHLRQRLDQQLGRAAAFHRRRVLTRMMGKWLSFTTRRATCRAASWQVCQRQLHQVFAGWRHAFARSSFVRGLEQQYDEAWRRRCWHTFVLAIRHKQAAREKWLAQLRAIVIRKVLSRWRQLIDLRRVTQLAADSLFSKTQQRVLHVVLNEWIHFTTLRAFVHLRQRREADRIQQTTLHQWRLYVIAKSRHRKCDQRIVSRAFHAWRKYALVEEAARVIERVTGQIAVDAAWKMWRLEFWIRQSQANARVEILRRCLDEWKAKSRSTSRRPTTRPTRHGTAFDEARLLHHLARFQRRTARRVVHAWALAAQTRRRQREKQLSPPQRVAHVIDFKIPSSCADRAEHSDSNMSSSDVCDQENMHPNARSAARRSVFCKPAQPNRRDTTDLEALEFWSTCVLKAAFHGWRSSVKRTEGFLESDSRVMNTGGHRFEAHEDPSEL